MANKDILHTGEGYFFIKSILGKYEFNIQQFPLLSQATYINEKKQFYLEPRILSY